jgi:hypothetical protein
MEREFRQIMISTDIKKDLDNMCFHIGKKSYAKIIQFLLEHYKNTKTF